jgi:hypothetical protein
MVRYEARRKANPLDSTWTPDHPCGQAMSTPWVRSSRYYSAQSAGKERRIAERSNTRIPSARRGMCRLRRYICQLDMYAPTSWGTYIAQMKEPRLAILTPSAAPPPQPRPPAPLP